MQASSTRIVTFEMCGNDFLQARSNFAGQSGTCNFGVLTTALNNCTNYQQLAMQAINTYAHANTKRKVISNIYYPGDAADAKGVRDEIIFPHNIGSHLPLNRRRYWCVGAIQTKRRPDDERRGSETRQSGLQRENHHSDHLVASAQLRPCLGSHDSTQARRC
jgi:hypothetical protein